MNLYDRVSISPGQLVQAAQQVAERWPNARLHKNEVTHNLVIYRDGEYVGYIDLLHGEVADEEED